MSFRWAISVLLTLASSALAQTKPTTRTPDCTTSGCHTAQTDRPFLHGPNAVHACDACHDYVDESKHTFELKRKGADLCRFCHINKEGTEGLVVHEPVAKGECASCHDPHGASNRLMLKKDTTAQLCVTCHKETLNGKNVHKPAGEDCTTCHKAHTADHAKLLTLEVKALCVSCHDSVAKTATGAAHAHEPMNKGDCLQCHKPHASDHIRALTAAPQALCTSCHKEIADKWQSAKRKHAPMGDDRSCLNCHVAHGSSHAKQLTDKPVDACLQCHKKPIVVDKTRTVASAAEIAVDTLHKHGPIKEQSCAACHTVHGGDTDRLLIAPYSREFYQPFTEAAYALCFQCHKKDTLLATSGIDLTKFRDAERNLHVVHLDRGKQGRSCRACHTPHASKNPAMIAESVSFGNWALPLNFKPTPSGGSCAPGCHKPAAYDRVTAVGKSPILSPLPTSSPAASPAAPSKAAPPTDAAPPSTPPKK